MLPFSFLLVVAVLVVRVVDRRGNRSFMFTPDYFAMDYDTDKQSC
jgi:hypothetical protein